MYEVTTKNRKMQAVTQTLLPMLTSPAYVHIHPSEQPISSQEKLCSV